MKKSIDINPSDAPIKRINGLANLGQTLQNLPNGLGGVVAEFLAGSPWVELTHREDFPLILRDLLDGRKSPTEISDLYGVDHLYLLSLWEGLGQEIAKRFQKLATKRLGAGVGDWLDRILEASVGALEGQARESPVLVNTELVKALQGLLDLKGRLTRELPDPRLQPGVSSGPMVSAPVNVQLGILQMPKTEPIKEIKELSAAPEERLNPTS
jgi:hypothetical protein